MLTYLFVGRQHDKEGNIRHWWNNETIKAFRSRAQCMIEQYSSYKLEPLGLYVSWVRVFGRLKFSSGLRERSEMNSHHYAMRFITYRETDIAWLYIDAIGTTGWFLQFGCNRICSVATNC